MKITSQTPLRIVSFSSIALLFAWQATTSQATAYNAAVLADNPLLYWTFDETSGNAFSQVNNTIDNELVPGSAAMRAPSYPGLGSAINPNGAQNATFSANDLFGGGADTVPGGLWATEFWFKPVGPTGKGYISNTGGPAPSAGDTNQPSFFFGFAGTNQIEACAKDGGTLNRLGVQNIALDDWHHMVFAHYGDSSTGTNLREMYIDGVLALTDTGNTWSTPHFLKSLFIGGSNATKDPYNGMIDEYAIYALNPTGDIAFSDQQLRVLSIAGHFNAIPEPGSAMLLGLGTLALVAIGRRRGKCV